MEWFLNHSLGHINGFDVLLWTGLAILHHYLFRPRRAAAQAAESAASQTMALPRAMPRKAPRSAQQSPHPREFRPEPALLRVRAAAARRAETRGRWADVLTEADIASAPRPRDQRLAA
jgi:hypothetical protein